MKDNDQRGPMAEILAGIIDTCEVITFNGWGEPQFGLRPLQDWKGPIDFGALIRLALPDGQEFQTRIKGVELIDNAKNNPPRAVSIKCLPELNGHVPSGTRVYIEE